MRLTQQEYAQYLRLHTSIMYYIGQKKKLFPKTTTYEDFRKFSTQEKHPIRNAIYENPHLQPVYKKELGRINARGIKKSLKELGIKKQHYAVYNDVVVTSSATLKDLEKKVQGLISSEEDRRSIYYFKL